MEKNIVNYQLKLEKILNKITNEGKLPKLLLHSCCAPCSSYVLEYLAEYFEITVLYYNPNIYPEEEYYLRVKEQKKFIDEVKYKNNVFFLEGEYFVQDFYNKVKGLESLKEGEERCYKCYELRLEETVRVAKLLNSDFFTTTLSISPYKNAKWLNEIGEKLSEKYNVPYLYSDFKKKNGYKRSIELSAQYGLYRQNYCGCIFSKRDLEN